jgi:uncharacterized protein YqhQ
MFLVLLIAILVFSILDTFVAIYIAPPSAFLRFLYHIPFIPLISGLGYEIIKLSDKKSNHFLVKLFTTPGMVLQKITTREPDEKQIHIAIIALKAAMNEDVTGYENINQVEI